MKFAQACVQDGRTEALALAREAVRRMRDRA